MMNQPTLPEIVAAVKELSELYQKHADEKIANEIRETVSALLFRAKSLGKQDLFIRQPQTGAHR